MYGGFDGPVHTTQRGEPNGHNRVLQLNVHYFFNVDPAKPCTKSRLLLAKLGGSLEGVSVYCIYSYLHDKS